MRPRLFWKILLAFWLTIALVTVGLIITFLVQTPPGSRFPQTAREMHAERLRAAALVLHYGGPAALDEMAGTWPPAERSRLKVSYAPDGTARLTLPFVDKLAGFPLWPLAFQIGAGLMFSAALAGYMVWPIGKLREGFGQLAAGDLTVRLTPGMGRRRDEIADLAGDFDRMAERLQHLIANRDRLLHDVSHELRSPLARLSLAVGLARQNGELNEQALSRIEAEGARLNALVGDLLSLSRVENRLDLEGIYFDIAGLVTMVCDDARFEAQPRQVAVALDIAPDLADAARAPLLLGAPELLRRAIDNVVRNALRFSPAHSTVAVRMAVEGERIVIEVADAGPGVPPHLLSAIFDPFVKGAGETRGVGLGLSIARRALAAHQGDIQAINRETGGLRVRMTLPLALGSTTAASTVAT